MNTHIRFARLQDTKEILSIYAPYVLHDSATFEYEVPSIEIFKQRIQTIQQFYPYLVYEENNEILGYAYASRYKERKAYDWDVEVSVYVRKDSLGKGIGAKLYTYLFAILKNKIYATFTPALQKKIQEVSKCMKNLDLNKLHYLKTAVISFIDGWMLYGWKNLYNIWKNQKKFYL